MVEELFLLGSALRVVGSGARLRVTIFKNISKGFCRFVHGRGPFGVQLVVGLL